MLPFFYYPILDKTKGTINLDEETSRYIISVLRMKPGEKINLADGKGSLVIAEIINNHKKHCTVEVAEIIRQEPKNKTISIGISLLKNSNRFEWFLEKATEIGVSEIIPLICERTEKEKFRYDRMNAICISAMLQSQQCWLPVLHEPKIFNKQTIKQFNHQTKLIAYCGIGDKQTISQIPNSQIENCIILVGPEGDFTKEEVDLAIQHHFIAVALGETRLRTETAGVVVATLLTVK